MLIELTSTGYLENIDNIIYTFKIIIISILSYYSSIKILNINTKNNFIITILITLSAIVSSFSKVVSNLIISIIVLMLLLSIIFSKFSKKNLGYSILINIISLSINYIFFTLAIILSFIPYILIGIKNDYINLMLISIIYIIINYIFFKIRKFKNGFIFLQKNTQNEYMDVIILNLSILLIFAFSILSNVNKEITRSTLIVFIILSVIMFITIKKSLQLYYKQQLQQREIEEMKKEIQEKDEEISKLEQENLNFSKTSHSIAHKQKSLEHKLNQLIMKNETAEEIDIKDRINNIQSELNKNTIVQLKETGIEQIDDMLKYMQSECTKNKIDFDLKINGNIHHMTNKYVEKETLEILLADLVKNAIIAINYSKNINKSILVKLGIIDGIYSIYVYDSGIEFEINTLINLGKKPSTTHADSGGTGMGFMNTFDSLNNYNASIQINEIGKESKDNYTKYIAIKFDNKHEFKINSYRKEEIEKLNNNKDIILENKN